MTRLVLASASQYRKQLLRRLGLDFVASPQDIDESVLDGETSDRLVQRLAQEKAQSCRKEYSSSALIIGSDQVASLGSNIFGKPGNHDNAVEQLRLCSGREVRFLTAVCILNSDTGQEQQFTDVTTVLFRSLSENKIESYVQSERPFSSCGSFQVEGLGISLVETITSNDPTALIGLPLIAISDYLAKAGMMPS